MNFIVSKKATKALRQLDEVTKERVKTAIRGLAEHPPKGDIRKLKGMENSYALRVTRWRVTGYIFFFGTRYYTRGKSWAAWRRL